MGCMVTRPGIARHAYEAMPQPQWVAMHAYSASVQSPRSGATMMPLSAPLATFAADGAPYYNTGYLPGYPSVGLPGGRVALRLPQRAAQVDLSDPTSWDRPVFYPGAI